MRPAGPPVSVRKQLAFSLPNRPQSLWIDGVPLTARGLQQHSDLWPVPDAA